MNKSLSQPQKPLVNVLSRGEPLQRSEQFVVAVQTNKGTGSRSDPTHQLTNTPVSEIREAGLPRDPS